MHIHVLVLCIYLIHFLKLYRSTVIFFSFFPGKRVKGSSDSIIIIILDIIIGLQRFRKLKIKRKEKTRRCSFKVGYIDYNKYNRFVEIELFTKIEANKYIIVKQFFMYAHNCLS